MIRIWEGDRAHLRKLARRWVGPAYKGKVDASDVVQETFLDALRAARVPARGSDYRPWLIQILWRNCLSLTKRFQRAGRDARRERPLDATPDRVAAPRRDGTLLDVLVQAERGVSIRCALARLAAGERAVLSLRAEDRLSFREIGDRLGKSEDAARMQWCRAVLALKRRLEEAP